MSVNHSVLSMTMKKAGKSLLKGLHDLKTATTPEEMIRNLVVDKDGKQTVDYHYLDFHYLQYPPKWKELDVSEWGQWIYDNFLGSSADIPINISYGNKMNIRGHFENDQERPDFEHGNSNSNSNSSIPNGIMDDESIDIFDAAQEEVWALMSNDSFAHFKRTKMVCDAFGCPLYWLSVISHRLITPLTTF